MSVLRTYRNGVKAHGLHAISTLTRYYAARVGAKLSRAEHFCPACGVMVGEYLPFLELHYGVVRTRAVCPSCGALERHRAYARFYRDFIPTYFGRRVDILHAASEGSLVRILRGFAARYDLCDYESPPPGHIRVDICDPQLPPSSYDLIVLNHVFACVKDDVRAAHALARLLRPRGAILAGERVFRGVDTRSTPTPGYGARFNDYGDGDVTERFAPLEVRIVDAAEGLTPAERARFGIADRETLLVLSNAPHGGASPASTVGA